MLKNDEKTVGKKLVIIVKFFKLEKNLYRIKKIVKNIRDQKCEKQRIRDNGGTK